MKISVIVPTYRRTKDLARCLSALQQQIRPADEVLVVVRETDMETWQFLNSVETSNLPLKTVKVTVAGVVAAMNCGVDAAIGDIMAFTDDDAAPHVDWLQRIEHFYQNNSQVGGVGGKDAIQHPGPWLTEVRDVVGRLQWYGRAIGNHHMGTGSARDVDVLKGVNMSFRRAAIEGLCFDQRMRGTGAQVHFELAFCLALKRRGWKLVYDPAIVVDHYPSQRFDEDQRHNFSALAFFNEVHNETLALLEHLPWGQRILFSLWATFIGSRRTFGVLQCIRFLPSEGRLALYKWRLSIQARRQAWLTLQTPIPSKLQENICP